MRKILLLPHLYLVLFVLGGCHPGQPTGTPAAPDAAPHSAEASHEAGMALTSDEIAHMGIRTIAAKDASFAAEVAGYAVVLGHDVIAQAIADVATAEASQRQSHSALSRIRALAGTPGAFAAETQEAAERQAAAEDVALTLSRRKLSATFGSGAPWQDRTGGRLLDDVASGRTRVLRASFPLGALAGPAPRTLQVARPDPGGKSERWNTGAVWAAPADATIPGRSLFALLNQADVGEGERLDVWSATDAHESGVLVPSAAVVISEGRYWCYVELKPGSFQRVLIDAARPVAGGYFMKQGIAAGTRIVVSSAGLLLARETNPSTEPE